MKILELTHIIYEIKLIGLNQNLKNRTDKTPSLSFVCSEIVVLDV